MEQIFDVAIIGGGINGCGCAADAAIRGLSVILIEEDDLASKTSSKSSKLIHGGLRYLENYDFYLVKKALDERQKLLELAPHLVHPLPLVLPHQKNMRPLWLLRMGLFIYDYLSRANKLPHSKLLSRNKQAMYFEPLTNHYNKGFLFYDGTADDARLTIANAIQAREHGATILPHTTLINAQVINQQWQLSLQTQRGTTSTIHAKTVINATGPWVEKINQMLQIPSTHHIALIKGSHLIVPKLYEGEHAYMLQHDDKRIVFVIPYYDYTLIGTTDVPFSGNPEHVKIDSDEINYLCGLINHYFNNQLNEKDIISTWSGVRPLLSATNKTPSTLSRDYTYHYVNYPAPAVTVYGGKITTYRQLATEAVNTLKDVFPDLAKSQTHKLPLPGATTNTMNFNNYQNYANKKYQWLEEKTKKRYLTHYGTRMETLLQECSSMFELGKQFASTLYQVEVDYLIEHEWATSCDDILWRRTKLGLVITDSEKKELNDYLKKKLASAENKLFIAQQKNCVD